MENSSTSNSCCSGSAKNTPWYLDRRFLIAATVAAVGAGLWLGWPTLGLLGLTPLLLALAPCLIMCGGMGAMMACKSGKKDAPQPEVAPLQAKPVTGTRGLPAPNPEQPTTARADGTGEIRLSA